jgi:hypothetical protein
LLLVLTQSQCLQQLGASSSDTISAALGAGCLCSKIGDVRQAETLLRQAFAASQVAAQVSQCSPSAT